MRVSLTIEGMGIQIRFTIFVGGITAIARSLDKEIKRYHNEMLFSKNIKIGKIKT